MPRIFISYRRADSGTAAEYLHEQLVRVFGAHNVFRDVHDIHAGEDFRAKIEQEIITSDVMLVVIGRDWLNMRDASGRRRLEDPADFVRLEVEMGLRHRLEVIPLLIFGAKMPDASLLPPSMYDLAFRNAITLRNPPRFDEDVDQLINGLRRIRRTRRASRGFGIGRLLAAALLLLVAAGVFLLVPRGDQVEEAFVFLLDQSEQMLPQVAESDETRFAMASRVISQVLFTQGISRPESYMALRTVGGGVASDCVQTERRLSGVSVSISNEALVGTFSALSPGGNTAYASGFQSGFADLREPELQNARLRFLFVFYGSLTVSPDCRAYALDPVTVGETLRAAEQQGISLVFCALTFFDDLDAYELLRRRLEAQGVDCLYNANNEAEAEDMVEAVVRRINSARDQIFGPQEIRLTSAFQTATITLTPTEDSATSTGTAVDTPTGTAVDTPTATVVTSTATAVDTPTGTDAPATPRPTLTLLPTATSAPTLTLLPTNAFTATSAPTLTLLPTATDTPTENTLNRNQVTETATGTTAPSDTPVNSLTPVLPTDTAPVLPVETQFFPSPFPTITPPATETDLPLPTDTPHTPPPTDTPPTDTPPTDTPPTDTPPTDTPPTLPIPPSFTPEITLAPATFTPTSTMPASPTATVTLTVTLTRTLSPSATASPTSTITATPDLAATGTAGADPDNDGVISAVDQCDQIPGTSGGCPDADGDGVPEAHDNPLVTTDLCPGTQAGAAVDATGCSFENDFDGDGVNDDIDLCNSQPGLPPDGCPDSDGDGFTDRNDLCPSEAGEAPDGCPPLQSAD